VNNIDVEIDPIMDDLRKRHESISRRAARWIEHKDAMLPLVRDMILLGCAVDMADEDLNIRFSGDKQKFLSVVRAQFRHGLRPDLSSLKKGSTEGTWFQNRGTLRIYTAFSSTVCRRVQIGTQTQEVPIYETVCDSPVPDSSELPDFGVDRAIDAPCTTFVETFDDIPF